MPNFAFIASPLQSAAASGAETACMNAPVATAEPLRAIMRSFEFTWVTSTASVVRRPVSPLARRARPLANPKSKIQNRKS